MNQWDASEIQNNENKLYIKYTVVDTFSDRYL